MKIHLATNKKINHYPNPLINVNNKRRLQTLQNKSTVFIVRFGTGSHLK